MIGLWPVRFCDFAMMWMSEPWTWPERGKQANRWRIAECIGKVGIVYYSELNVISAAFDVGKDLGLYIVVSLLFSNMKIFLYFWRAILKAQRRDVTIRVDFWR